MAHVEACLRVRRAMLLFSLLATLSAAKSAKEMTITLNDGTIMPMVGLGTWKSSKGEVEAAVAYALCEAGYRHIDAAQIYMNQEEVGRGINHALKNCGLKRENLWVTSKVWNSDFKDISKATDRILEELGLDYVDQLLLHWPTPYERPPPECPPSCPAKFSGTDDPMRPRGPDGALVLSSHPLSATWQDMEKVKAAGKVRSIGVSNFSPEEIESLIYSKKRRSFGHSAEDITSTVPAVNQVEAHVYWNQIGLRAAMRHRGIKLVAYSPLGNPAIYSDRLEGMQSSLITDVAEEWSLTPAQVMLTYLLSQGDVVVPKSVTPARISSNIDFNFSLGAKNLTAAWTSMADFFSSTALFHFDDRLDKAPQTRLSNPKLRAGGKPVFVDPVDKKEL